MKNILLIACVTALFFGCKNGDSNKATLPTSNPEKTNQTNSELYFEYSIDGKKMQVAAEDISTTYNEFSATDKEFKIFAGKADGPTLTISIISDMSKPSNTPNGSVEAGSKLFQGSVSLQGFPKKEYTFNNYDGFINPKPTPVAGAVVITNSEKLGDEARVLTGTINTTVLGGDNPTKNPDIKDRQLVGKFRIKHIFSGIKF